MGLQIFPATGGTASFDGLFFSRTDLQAGGLASDAELADAVAANIKRDKALFALSQVLTAGLIALNSLDRLGLTITQPDTASSTYQFGIGGQRYTKLNAADPFKVLPVPSTGANSGRGDVALVDFFPHVAKVAAAASVSEAGILIETAPLVNYAAPAYATESVLSTADNRGWIMGFFQWMAADSTTIPTRSTTVPSAVIARSSGSPSVITLPTDYTTGTDPVTGLAEADRPYTVLAQWGASTISFNTAKVIAPDGSQTWDVNSVTS